MLIGDLIRRPARRHPHKTALVSGGRMVSFGELDALADRFAGALARRGLGHGDVVTIHGENDWAWAAAYYGTARAGCTVNPVNALLTPTELDYIARDCDSKLVIASAAKAASLADGQAVIVYGGDTGRGERFEAVLEEHGPPPSVELTDQALSTICYTSGTTGQPKGAMLSHRNVVTNARMTALMHGRREDDVVVSALPLSHVYGNIVLSASLLSGATVALFPRFDPAVIVEALVEHGATMFEGVPTMYHYLLEHPGFHAADLGALRLCTVGGQSMAVEAMARIEQVTGCPLVELWGMTELGGLGTTHPYTGPYRHGSIGIGLPFVETRIADADEPSRPLRDGETGELLIRGPVVMMGYHRQPEATADALTADGWLRTGDIARRDPEGFLHVVDRKKDMILTAGYNIYPAELERVIAACPAVAMAAVGAVPDPVKGEVPRAYVVLKKGASATEADILAHCRAHLAPYKIPRGVTFVADLPKTSTGKIMRRALRQIDDNPVLTA